MSLQLYYSILTFVIGPMHSFFILHKHLRVLCDTGPDCKWRESHLHLLHFCVFWHIGIKLCLCFLLLVGVAWTNAYAIWVPKAAKSIVHIYLFASRWFYLVLVINW